jgi:cytochrome c biogenesis protein CcmG/thiol:disulfide interchange protein DsbE
VRIALRLLGAGLAVAFVALLFYGLTTKATNGSIDDALSRGVSPAAPGFNLAAFETGEPRRLAAVWRRAEADGQVRLEELRGTPVVLNFWASWCDPCRDEADVLQEGWRDAERQRVLVLGLNQQDAREDARAFLREFSVSFPQVRDPGNETARRWGVGGIPETFFISRTGAIVGHVIGVVSEDQLSAGITAARTGRPVGAKSGGDQRPTR